MTLTQDQQNALDQITSFIDSPEGTSFLLEGGAGVGKTFLLGEILRSQPSGIRACCTPTHKATNVLRRKLDAFDVPWCKGYDEYSFNGSDCITGTTAQLLGLRPILTDDQTTELKFGKAGDGILGKVMPRLIVIDEVSMLGSCELKDLIKTLGKAGSKLLLVGDAGQLPPVQKKPIPFTKFRRQAALRQVVRQAEDSAIIKVAWAIREGNPWRGIEGKGVRREKDLTGAFIESVKAPGERPEEEREVYIAYRNARVDAVQEKACQRLYGHGAGAFAKGELVLSEVNLYRGSGRYSVLLCANGDELMVEEFHEEHRDATLGVPVTMRKLGKKGVFAAYYLSPEALENDEHPYNVELEKRLERAKDLQARWKKERSEVVNAARKSAWAAYFSWRDQTIISFRHPFAITSHKSQGSTYRAVFADVADLGRYSHHALYVAVTRPKDELVVEV